MNKQNIFSEVKVPLYKNFLSSLVSNKYCQRSHYCRVCLGVATMDGANTLINQLWIATVEYFPLTQAFRWPTWQATAACLGYTVSFSKRWTFKNQLWKLACNTCTSPFHLFVSFLVTMLQGSTGSPQLCFFYSLLGNGNQKGVIILFCYYPQHYKQLPQWKGEKWKTQNL